MEAATLGGGGCNPTRVAEDAAAWYAAGARLPSLGPAGRGQGAPARPAAARQRRGVRGFCHSGGQAGGAAGGAAEAA
eukprot:scaffold32872_cov84-Phaeocystis_antarctica.AAC.1